MSIDDVSNCSDEEEIDLKADGYNSTESSKSIDKIKIEVDRNAPCVKADADNKEGAITPLQIA